MSSSSTFPGNWPQTLLYSAPLHRTHLISITSISSLTSTSPHKHTTLYTVTIPQQYCLVISPMLCVKKTEYLAISICFC